MHSFKGRELQQCDFLTRLLHTDLKELQQAVRRVKHWLARMGLQLHAHKTRITHTLTPHQGQIGFDFLGFNIRQEPVEKTAVGKSGQEASLGMKTSYQGVGKPRSYPATKRPAQSVQGRNGGSAHALTNTPRVKTIITPSPEASKRHLAAIDQRLQQLQTASQARVIEELNPLIVGWTAYFNGIVPATTMSRYDDLVEQRLMKWAGKRHPGKARDWLLSRYWQHVGKHKRVFATHDEVQLRTYRQTSILKG